jgi:urease accessory protein
MKKNQFWQYLVGAIAITLAVSPMASAHTGVGDHHGFLAGLVHPIGGLDHILAMVAVGLWAVQLGGTALWLIPSAFVIAMAGSSVIGYWGLPLPGVEQGILASDFSLGLLLLFATRLPLAIGVGIVTILATFHGYAHGAEMPSTASGLTYGLGFVMATATLHLIGIGLGLAIVGEASPLENRYQPKVQKLLFQLGGGGIIMGAVYVLVNH